MPFNPNDYLIKLKGKDYLEVKWRLVWFRDDHPDWCIETEVLTHTDKLAVVRARIIREDGRLAATGTKSETPSGFPDYLEKAETGSVGRALGLLGYGTQFAPEFEEGDRVVDSPVALKPQQTLVDAAKRVFGDDKVTETTEPPAPIDPDAPHPNRNKATIAITRTIAIAADKAGFKTDVDKHKAASEFFKRPIVTFFDIGEKPADYQGFLKHLTELSLKANRGNGGG